MIEKGLKDGENNGAQKKLKIMKDNIEVCFVGWSNRLAEFNIYSLQKARAYNNDAFRVFTQMKDGLKNLEQLKRKLEDAKIEIKTVMDSMVNDIKDTLAYIDDDEDTLTD